MPRQGRPRYRNVHRTLLIRLTIAAVVISGVLGLGMYYYEVEKVDDALVDLAVTESQRLTDDALAYLPPRSDTDHQALEGILTAFMTNRQGSTESHFVFAELYGPDREKVAELIEPHRDYVEKEMDSGGHKFPETRAAWYRKLSIGHEVFLQAVVGLYAADGTRVGFFEGVYQVAPDTLMAVTEAAMGSVVLVVLTVILSTVILYPIVRGLNRDLIERSHDLLLANINTLEVLGDAIAKRDSDTSVHNYRVTIYAVRLAQAVGVEAAAVRSLIKGAFLHDVGKIAISDAILLKPGRLTEDEFTVMKTHVEHGIDIVARSTWLEDAVDVVHYHHEKVDGSGYPEGLAGDAIPRNARIFAIADVFDALTSRRPYKEPMPLEKALDILREGRGKHFDAEILDAFCAMAPALYGSYANRADEAVEADLRLLTQTYFEAPSS